MGITVSIMLIAAGAIMRWAVTATTEGFNIHTAGMILFVIGLVGAAVSLAFWSSWGGFPRRTVTYEDRNHAAIRRTAVVRDSYPADPHPAPIVEHRDKGVVIEERIDHR